MTALQPAWGKATPADGPIECAPWCAQGDGHPDQWCLDDQHCIGALLRVDTTLEPPIEQDHMHQGFWVSAPDHVSVFPYRAGPAAADELRLLRGSTDEDIRFTPDEARQLIEALQLGLGQIEAAS